MEVVNAIESVAVWLKPHLVWTLPMILVSGLAATLLVREKVYTAFNRSIIDIFWVGSAVISLSLLTVSVNFEPSVQRASASYGPMNDARTYAGIYTDRFYINWCSYFSGRALPEMPSYLCDAIDDVRVQARDLFNHTVHLSPFVDVDPMATLPPALTSATSYNEEMAQNDYRIIMMEIMKFNNAAASWNDNRMPAMIGHLGSIAQTFWLHLFAAFAALRLGRAIVEAIERFPVRAKPVLDPMSLADPEAGSASGPYG